jgi:hypothetical protein
MSDFITGLRGDLVQAVERHARRGQVRRTTWRLHPRAWRPQAVLAAVAVAATVVAVAAAVRALTPPQRQAGTLHVVAVVRTGGQPVDAVRTGGSLWIADYGGRVVRVDTRARRVAGAGEVGGDPTSVTVADDTVLLLAASDASTPRSQLYGIDPASGRITARRALGQAANDISSSAGGVWYIPSEHRPAIERLDLASGTVNAHVRFPRAATLAVGGTLVWALGAGGTVVAIDATTAEIALRLRRVAIPNDTSAATSNLIAADADGAWVADQRGSRLLRIKAGRVVRRVPLAGEPHSIALTDDTLWVGSGDDVRRRYRLSRVDPTTGDVLSTVDLGTRDPKALVPDGSSVWVAASDGTALLVSS